jgi:hypothetical protein
MMFLSIPPLLSMRARVGTVREPKISRSFQTRRIISRVGVSKVVLVEVSKRVGTYHAENPDRLIDSQTTHFNLLIGSYLPWKPNIIPSCWNRAGVSQPEGRATLFAVRYRMISRTRSTSSGNLA